MKRENLDFYSKLTVVVLGASALAYVVFRYLLTVVFPFLIAWSVALAVRPLAKKLHKYIKIPERALRLIIALLLISLTAFLVFFSAYRLLMQGWRILNNLSEGGALDTLIDALLNPESLLSRFLPQGVVESISGATDAAVKALLSTFADFAAGFVSGVPRIFLFIIITLIAVVYFTLDLEGVNSFFGKKTPPRVLKSLLKLKNGFFTVGVRYVRAYLTVMLVVFSVSIIGLLLLGVEYAFLLAVIISALDILPAVGVGTVLVPWGIFEIATGSAGRGIGLIVLFLIVELVRQIVEPRVVGKNLGLHPLASLLLLWSAYSILGFLGIIFVPVLVVIIYALFGKNNTPKVKEDTVKKADGA